MRRRRQRGSRLSAACSTRNPGLLCYLVPGLRVAGVPLQAHPGVARAGRAGHSVPHLHTFDDEPSSAGLCYGEIAGTISVGKYQFPHPSRPQERMPGGLGGRRRGSHTSVSNSVSNPFDATKSSLLELEQLFNTFPVVSCPSHRLLCRYQSACVYA